MSDHVMTMTEQIQSIFSAFHKLNAKDKDAKQKFIEQVNNTSLPSQHKEIMLVTLLTESAVEVPLALHLLRRREELRHADALLKIESAVLAERMKKDRSAPAA